MFWYLGQGYTREDRDDAYIQACRAAALLERAGISVFSPVVHGHSLSKHGDLPPEDSAFWERVNRPFVQAARGLIVLRWGDWRNSEGLTGERTWFYRRALPIVPMDPGRVPEELMAPVSVREAKYG